jgi:hypothetical protein
VVVALLTSRAHLEPSKSKLLEESPRGQDLWLETTQVNAALADADFWVYVVENIAQGDPAEFRLAMIGGQRLAALLRRRRERHYFEVPWPVADYDSDPPRAMNP